jgi:hypothetical protein
MRRSGVVAEVWGNESGMAEGFREDRFFKEETAIAQKVF